LITTNTQIAVCDMFDCIGSEIDMLSHTINDYKVIAKAVHFGKFHQHYSELRYCAIIILAVVHL
jgi:hypothetical protein